MPARRLLLLAFVLLVGAASVTRPDGFFRAKRPCIIHSEDSGSSPNVGRLEVGQTAPILETNSTGKWVKVAHGGAEGRLSLPTAP